MPISTAWSRVPSTRSRDWEEPASPNRVYVSRPSFGVPAHPQAYGPSTMTKRMIVGLLVALFAGFAAAAVLASPRDDQYGNSVTQETAPIVTTGATTTVSTESVSAATTTAETTTAATTTTETTTAATTTTETTTPTVVVSPAENSAPAGGKEAPAAAAGGSELPFTGIGLGLIVAGGLAAAGAGLVLRRVSRGRRS